MKRFVAAAVLLLALGLGAYWAIYYQGLYLPSSQKDAPEIWFRAEGKSLQRWDGQEYSNVILRGVDVSSSQPGHYSTAYDASKEDYLRWFKAIGEMGANAVRAVNIMDDDFYNALYDHNTTHDSPLYLLQGTSVEDSVGDGSGDAYDKNFLDVFLEDGKTLVDIIHGQKDLPAFGIRSGGIYRKDLSPWVAGFLVGTVWYPDTISYTDNNTIRSGVYEGAYFQTVPGAAPFEAAMARIMDGIAAYETEKYGVQRPVGFLCDPACDFLEYEEVYARQLGKHAQTDPEHILPTKAMGAGCFAAYRLYDFCDSFADRLSSGQEQALAPYLSSLEENEPYGGYLELLSEYHTMPVVAAGYGVSSARGAAVMGQTPRSEQEQGRQLAEICRTLESDGWAGGFISTWQDEWERTSWNTAFAAVPSEHYLWHDLQTEGQNFGLMAFEPGTEEVCTLDGDPSEWEEEDVLIEQKGRKLSVRYDAEGLYLLLEGVNQEETVYIPLDVSPEMGSTVCEDPALSFQRQADLLLCLDGVSNSRLLVQERWDSMRERFLYETDRVDPFIHFPEKNGSFVPVNMVVKNPVLVEILSPDPRYIQRLGVWETGKLTHGSENRGSEDYDSLADFCFGQDCVEIRLPWLLLNVGSPASMKVHRDYYTHYGVEFKTVREIGIGAAGEEGDAPVPMASFRLRGWMNLEYRERLKDSYYIMQDYWRGTD